MIHEEVVVLDVPFDDAVDAVKSAFADHGFGALTEIDMQATLRKKIGKEMPRFVIVGACNPHLASRAIDVMPQIGVLLPCNVVIREEGDQVVVEAMDPGLMSSVTGSEAVGPIAAEARRLVGDALAQLRQAG